MGKIKQYIEEKKLNILDLTFILFFLSRMLTSTLSIFMGGMKAIFLSMLILAILYLWGMIVNIRRKNYSFLYFFILFFSITTLSLIAYLFNEPVRYWLMEAEFSIFSRLFDVRKAFFGFLVVILVFDKDKIYENLKIFAYINFFYLVLQIFLYYVVNDWRFYFTLYAGKSKYNMDLGYLMTFSAVILYGVYFIEKNKLPLILSLIASALSIIYGSRGVMVLMMVFILLTFLFLAKGKKEKIRYLLTHLLYFLVLIVSIFIVNKSIELTSRVIDETKSLVDEDFEKPEDPEEEKEEGSRNIEMLMSGDITNSNGRMNIWTMSLKAGINNPIFGRGLFGDRDVIGSSYRWGYSHNFFLEVFSNFGIIGLCLVFYLAYLTFRVLLSKDKIAIITTVILLTMSAKLMLSDSFYFNEHFWAIVAYYIVLFNNKTDKYKLKLLATGLLFVASLVLFALNLKQAYEDQDFKYLEFNKPTALVYFNKSNKDEVNYYEKLEDESIKISSFVSPSYMRDIGKLNIYDLKANKKDIDYQDGGYTQKNYKTIRTESIRDITLKDDQWFEDLGLEKPVAVLPNYYAYNDSTHYNLLGLRKFHMSKAKSPMVYKSINKRQAHELRSNVITSELIKDVYYDVDGNEKTNEYIDISLAYTRALEAIDKAYERNGLVILEFRPGKSEYEHMLIEPVLEYLMEKDFSYINFKDLDEMTKIDSQTDLKRNLLKNSLINSFIK